MSAKFSRGKACAGGGGGEKTIFSHQSKEYVMLSRLFIAALWLLLGKG